MHKINLGKYNISDKSDPFIIAEIGANHNGNFNLAVKLIDKAVSCGCHCAKFQSWSKESLFAKSVYINDKQLEDEIEKYTLSLEQLHRLKKYCEKKKIIFSTSVFSRKEFDYFVNINIDFVKIASMDLNNYSFLEYVAKKNVPTILSTGLSVISEVNEAVKIFSKYNKKLILLHCITLYPPEDEFVNLNNIDLLRKKYELPVGYSDHSLGISIPLAAVAKGACVIEKHFTLNKELKGWDHKISADPEEMEQLVAGSKRIKKVLGSENKILSKNELEMRRVFRRSIVAARNIFKGEIITFSDLDFKRPGTGLEPGSASQLIGRKAKFDIQKDNLIFRKDFI